MKYLMQQITNNPKSPFTAILV